MLPNSAWQCTEASRYPDRKVELCSQRRSQAPSLGMRAKKKPGIPLVSRAGRLLMMIRYFFFRMVLSTNSLASFLVQKNQS